MMAVPDRAETSRMAATRASYDAVAGAYAEAMSDELRHKPLDRALLTAFGEQVPQVGTGEDRVWDVASRERLPVRRPGLFAQPTVRVCLLPVAHLLDVGPAGDGLALVAARRR